MVYKIISSSAITKKNGQFKCNIHTSTRGVHRAKKWRGHGTAKETFSTATARPRPMSKNFPRPRHGKNQLLYGHGTATATGKPNILSGLRVLVRHTSLGKDEYVF